MPPPQRRGTHVVRPIRGFERDRNRNRNLSESGTFNDVTCSVCHSSQNLKLALTQAVLGTTCCAISLELLTTCLIDSTFLRARSTLAALAQRTDNRLTWSTVWLSQLKEHRASHAEALDDHRYTVPCIPYDCTKGELHPGCTLEFRCALTHVARRIY
jgi:hypothetical protein